MMIVFPCNMRKVYFFKFLASNQTSGVAFRDYWVQFIECHTWHDANAMAAWECKNQLLSCRTYCQGSRAEIMWWCDKQYISFILTLLLVVNSILQIFFWGMYLFSERARPKNCPRIKHIGIWNNARSKFTAITLWAVTKMFLFNNFRDQANFWQQGIIAQVESFHQAPPERLHY